jgi:hypothetical protein
MQVQHAQLTLCDGLKHDVSNPLTRRKPLIKIKKAASLRPFISRVTPVDTHGARDQFA